MIRRLLILLIAAGLIAIVVWLGVLSADHAGFIAPFGIAAAIAGPLAIYLLGEVLRSQEKTTLRRLERLDSVPEIANLIEQAQSAEERLRVLQTEYARIEDAMKLEARRLTLIERQELLRVDAERLLHEFAVVDEEISSLRLDIGNSAVLSEVRALETRLAARRRGDYIIRIGPRQYVLPQGLLDLTGPSWIWPFQLWTSLVSAVLRSWRSAAVEEIGAEVVPQRSQTAILADADRDAAAPTKNDAPDSDQRQEPAT